MTKSYSYQALSLEREQDRDILEFLSDLKKQRLASAFIKLAIRKEMYREDEEE